MSSSGGSNPIPQAQFPIPPPLGSMAIIDAHTGRLTTLGLSFFTQLWAGIQGGGGVVDQISTIFGMHGDATLSSAGEITVVSSEGRDFVASAFIDTTDADNITRGTLSPDRIADGSLDLTKLAQQVASVLVGNPTGAEGAIVAITLGLNLRFTGTSLAACADVFAVAGLGTAAAGARAFANDANATTFGTIVAGGGGNFVPVYGDGTNWRIG